MFGLFAVTAAALLGAVPQVGKTQARFEQLAKDIKYFPTGEFVYGRSDKLSRLLPDRWKEPWYVVLKEISSAKHAVADLQALLKHMDPNVRLLALAALFQREDPKLLPKIAAMAKDEGRTVPDLFIVRAISISFGKGDPAAGDPWKEDFHPQTVGKVATQFLATWLNCASYEDKDFDVYWAVRKDRTYCASWFLARLYRAGGAMSPFDKARIPLIQAIRKDVDAVPGLDHDWTLLWVATHSIQSLSEEPGRAFASEEELLQAGKRLGPGRLVDLIQHKEISTDPDLAASDGKTQGPHDLILWVLKNAGKLLRPEDAPGLLAAEKTLRHRSPWCAIGAAELQPDNAPNWLRGAFSRFSDSYRSSDRVALAAALWRFVGESQIDYLADWFYAEKVATNPHSTQTGLFLEAIKGVRAPADRKLVVRLVTDVRVSDLDYQSLRSLIEVVNGWMKIPVVGDRELRPIWEKGTWSPTTAADAKIVQSWRTKLRASVPEWQAK